jgi:N-acetylglucosaminyl-diphospho-decaprenol L-rhamnosyltransferase
MKYDISIIIVLYKSEKHIGPLLDSIEKPKDGLKKQVIVIDNYTQDNSAKIAKKHPLKPTVLEPGENLGFAKAVNLGLTKTTGEYIFLINPDTTLVGNSLKTLHSFAAKTSPLGAVVPKLVFSGNQAQPSVMKFPNIWNAFKHYFLCHKNQFGKYLPKKAVEQVEVAVMAAFLIPMKVIKQIGILDERFFLYYEDVDYCRRLKEANLPIYYLSKAKVRHVHGASANFVSHLKSPLAKSAIIYHGWLGSNLLNLTLWFGQKWQKFILGK